MEAEATGVRAKVEVHVELDYFNSISAKYLVSMLIQLKDALAGTGRLAIMWYYDFLDNETLEWGGGHISDRGFAIRDDRKKDL